ncbi:MAG: DNA polymerase III subunit beta, partial [Kovacikia sp.]
MVATTSKKSRKNTKSTPAETVTAVQADESIGKQPTPAEQAEIAEQSNAEAVDDRILQWLVTAPVSDVNFTENVKVANAATLAAALEQIKQLAAPSKTKIKVLQVKLKKLTPDTQEAPIAGTEPETENAEESPSKPKIAGFKFTCDQDKLSEFLPTLKQVASRGGPHVVLGHILFEVDAAKNRVFMTAFNLSMAIRVSVEATVDVGGTFTLPAVLLNDLVSRLPVEPLAFTHDVDELRVTVSSSVGKHQLLGIDAEEFPALPEFNGKSFDLPMGALRKAIDLLSFSISTDETKQVLTGAHFNLKNTPFEVASTDGHRMSVYAQKLEDYLPPQVTFTLPGWVLSDLKRIAPETAVVTAQLDDTIKAEDELLPTSGYIKFATPVGNVLMCRLIEGQYPDYRRLIPTEFGIFVTVERLPFIAAIERVALFTERGIVKLDIRETSIGLSAQFSTGNGDEQMAATLTGPLLTIAFDARYLIEALRAVGGEEATIKLNSATSPVLMTAENFEHLLM